MEPAVLQPDEDAQAEINALQRQVDELIAQLRDGSEELAQSYAEQAALQRQVADLTAKLEAAESLQSQLAAERERIRAATQIIIEEIGATGPEDLESALGRMVARLAQFTADLARVTQERDRLRALIAALPKVERETEIQSQVLGGYSLTRMYIAGGKVTVDRITFPNREDAKAYAALLRERQGSGRLKSQSRFESGPCSTIVGN